MRLFTALQDELQIKTALLRRVGFYQFKYFPHFCFSVLVLSFAWYSGSAFVFQQDEKQTLILSPVAYNSLLTSNRITPTKSAASAFVTQQTDKPLTLHERQPVADVILKNTDFTTLQSVHNKPSAMIDMERLNLVRPIQEIPPQVIPREPLSSIFESHRSSNDTSINSESTLNSSVEKSKNNKNTSQIDCSICT